MSWAELIGSLKLGNVWVFVQLICGPPRPESAVQKPKHCLTWDFPSALFESSELVFTYRVTFSSEFCWVLNVNFKISSSYSQSFTTGSRTWRCLARTRCCGGRRCSSPTCAPPAARSRWWSTRRPWSSRARPTQTPWSSPPWIPSSTTRPSSSWMSFRSVSKYRVVHLRLANTGWSVWSHETLFVDMK